MSKKDRKRATPNGLATLNETASAQYINNAWSGPAACMTELRNTFAWTKKSNCAPKHH